MSAGELLLYTTPDGQATIQLRALDGTVWLSQAELAELFISAGVTRGEAMQVSKTDHAKCGRCWRLLPEVSEDGALCDRCEDVVAQMDAVG